MTTLAENAALQQPSLAAHKNTLPPNHFDNEIAEQSSRLPKVLRSLGVVTLLASVSIYLMQGWEAGSHLTRFLLLWGHTIALAGVGIFCSQFLKEQKGARILLMMALVFVAANFAILGGFIYSVAGADAKQLHESVRWVMVTDATTLLTLTVTGLVMMPIVLLGFKVLARTSAMQLSVLFIVGCTALLLPVRDGLYSYLVLLGLAALLFFGLLRKIGCDVRLNTFEGRIAKLITALPMGIMIGRNFMHDDDVFTFAIVAGAIWVLCRQVALSLEAKSIARKLLEVVSIIPSIFVALAGTAMCDELFSINFITAFLVFFALLSGLFAELSLRAGTGRQVYSVLSALMLALATLVAWLNTELWSVAIFACIAGSALSAFGLWQRRQAPLTVGIILLLIGVVLTLTQLFDNFNMNTWLLMTVIGMLAIVAASYVEKRGEQVKAYMLSRKDQLASWQY